MSNRRRRRENWSSQETLARALLTEIDHAPDAAGRRLAEDALGELLATGKEPPGAWTNGAPVAGAPPWLARLIPPPGQQRKLRDGVVITTYPDGLVDLYAPPGHPWTRRYGAGRP